MSWLEWIGLISLIVHGSIGAALTVCWGVDRMLSYTDLWRAIYVYYARHLRREHDKKDLGA